MWGTHSVSHRQGRVQKRKRSATWVQCQRCECGQVVGPLSDLNVMFSSRMVVGMNLGNPIIWHLCNPVRLKSLCGLWKRRNAVHWPWDLGWLVCRTKVARKWQMLFETTYETCSENLPFAPGPSFSAFFKQISAERRGASRKLEEPVVGTGYEYWEVVRLVPPKRRSRTN